MRIVTKLMLLGVLVLSIAGGLSAQTKSKPASGPIAMKVYKSPTCGCCAKWVEHVKAAGFVPEVHDLPSVGPIKENAGVPSNLQSCHTALVGGYVVEGHVPVDVIQKLLDEKPSITGIAVPGMPAGSPGMEQGDRKDPYEVIAFTKGGKTSVFVRR
jgi:hypothetical protein